MKLKIMLHHSAVSRERNADQFKANNAYHRQLWNFKSSLGYYLGYTYEISAKGKVRKARKIGERTAACYQNGMNKGCIHICIDGNFDIEKPTPEQIYRLRDLLLELCKKYNIEKQDIHAHNEFADKSCPGTSFPMEFVKNLVPGKVEVKKTLLQELKDLVKKYG